MLAHTVMGHCKGQFSLHCKEKSVKEKPVGKPALKPKTEVRLPPFHEDVIPGGLSKPLGNSFGLGSARTLTILLRIGPALLKATLTLLASSQSVALNAWAS